MKAQETIQDRDEHGRWRPGQCGNLRGGRLRIERRAELSAKIEAELGGNVSDVDRFMIQRAAEMLTRKARDHNEAVRILNAGSRIIDRLRDKYSKRKPVHSDGLNEAFHKILREKRERGWGA